MEQVKNIFQQIQDFLNQSFGMFRDNVAKWLNGGINPLYYGFLAALLVVLVILVIIGVVSSLRNHPKLFTTLIILAVLFGAACLFIPKI